MLLFHVDDELLQLEKIKLAVGSTLVDAAGNVQLNSFSSSSDYLRSVKETRKPDVALIDLHFNNDQPQVGLQLIAQTKYHSPETVIIVYSNDLDLINKAMAKGAHDFILKQCSTHELPGRIKKIVQLVKDSPFSKNTVIGETMNRIAQRIPKIVSSAVRTAYIEGETGTGKEVVADLFQNAANAPFIRINCAAISPHLLESELFGFVKGAFTDAKVSKIGFIEAANKGWLYLDEIACLTLEAQAALLRAIENQEIIRVGEHQPRKVNFRVLSASNVPLEQLVKENKFRNDLWQRLRETEIFLPPLRDRMSEVKVFLNHFCTIETGGPYELSDEARSILESVSWQSGNVRAIRNCIRAMTENHIDHLLTPLSIPKRIWDGLNNHEEHDHQVVDNGKMKTSLAINIDGDFPTFDHLADLLFLETLKVLTREQSKCSIRGIAQILGIPKSSLAFRIKKLVEKGLTTDHDMKLLFEK